MSRADAIAALGAALTAALGFAYFAYSAGSELTAPRVKSGRELCAARGGVYVQMRYGPDRCFSKDAFK